MRVDDILQITPKLSDGEFVVPQPSLEQLIRAHYANIDITGDGQILADRYIQVLKEKAAGVAPIEAAAPVQKPAPAPDEIDLSLLRSVVFTMVRNYADTYREGPNAAQLEQYIRKWKNDPRASAQLPALLLIELPSDNPSCNAAHDALKIALHLAEEGTLYQTPAGRYYITEELAQTYESIRPIKPDQPKADPFDAMRKAGVDFKIGGVDFVAGLESTIKNGNPSPLIAGLAGLVIGALATADKPKD